ALPVEADHARRNPCKHCLDEASSCFDLTICVKELFLLTLQVTGHPIEGRAKRADLVPRIYSGYANCQVAGAHPFGGGNETSDGATQAIGKCQSYPGSGQQKQNGYQEEDQGKGNNQPCALSLYLLVNLYGSRGSFEMPHNSRVHHAPHEQVGVAIDIQLYQCSQPIALIARKNDDGSPLRTIECRI